MIDLNQIFHASGAANVSIDVNIPEDLFGTKELVERMPETIADIVRAARTFWESEADAELWTTRSDYKDAIHISQEGDAWSLLLEGEHANFIEIGGDMKPGLLGGKKATTSERTGLRYNRIPMKSIGGPVSIRTVSDASPASSWVHPGVNIAERVHDELIERIIPDFIEKLLDEVLS